jgi:CelD/BcsL family acetyltransferase involved in cellulose biosynthesis
MTLRAHIAEAHPEPVLQWELYTSWEDVAALGAAWEDTLRHSAGPTIFSTSEWLGAWWKAFGEGKPLVILALSSASGELVGLAPFYRDRLPGGIHQLRLVGDGSEDSDNLDLIFRAGHEEACAQALLAWLATDSAWDLCELNTLPADSPTIRPLVQALQDRRWAHSAYTHPNSAVTLPATWEAYLEQLPKEHARGIQRYTRRLHRHYAARIIKCAYDDELPTFLGALFDLHQRRWNAQGQSGNFVSPARRRFYQEMGRAFLRRGWLEFWLLELNGKIAAAQFAFRFGDTVYQLQEGLDPAHFSDRAGHVLRAHVLQQLIAAGVRRYDYLGGAETHKQHWGAQVGHYVDLHFVARPFSRAALYMHARHGAYTAKDWLRAHAPRSTYSLLRDLYHRYTDASDG